MQTEADFVLAARTARTPYALEILRRPTRAIETGDQAVGREVGVAENASGGPLEILQIAVPGGDRLEIPFAAGIGLEGDRVHQMLLVQIIGVAGEARHAAEGLVAAGVREVGLRR